MVSHKRVIKLIKSSLVGMLSVPLLLSEFGTLRVMGDEVSNNQIYPNKQYFSVSTVDANTDAVDFIADMIGNCNTSKEDLTSFGLSKSDLANAWLVAQSKQRLKYNSYATGITYSYDLSSKKVTNFQIITSDIPNSVNANATTLKNKVNQIVAATSGMSEFQKALYIHDYIVYNCEYEYDNYLGSSISESGKLAYGALVNGKATCNGYAQAFCLLADAVGLESEIVISDDLLHSWNMVKINGNWYHLDVSFDDPVDDTMGNVNHDYFLKTDDEMLADKDHNLWNEGYPECLDTTYQSKKINRINSKVITIDNQQYYLYGTGAVKSIYKGNIESSLPGTLVSSSSTGYQFLTTYENKLFVAEGNIIYQINIDGSNKVPIITAASKITEMMVNNNGTIYYVTSNSNTVNVTTVSKDPTISYSTHIQDIGWQNFKNNGETSGTSGLCKRLEAIKINLYPGLSDISGSIRYSTHIQDIGWQSFVTNGAMSGTSGQCKRLEAIKIELTGNLATQYDIYYRVHTQDFGWLGWAKNGAEAGTAGYCKRLEAIQIKLVKKGSQAPGDTTNCYYNAANDPVVSYRTHVQDYGWQGYVSNGAMSGTSGQSKRLEGINIKLGNISSGGITYSTHVQDYGWQGYVSNGTMSGTSGQCKRLEAIRIKLTGTVANNYDIYYRVHAQDYGWLDWAKNGESAGTSGMSKRLEAIQIKIVRKGDAAPGSTAQAYVAR